MAASYVRMFESHVRALRATHGNRKLLLDDVVIAYFLTLFNPTLRSLRTTEDFSQARRAQRSVGGSFFSVAADMAWAVQHATNKGDVQASVRLDMHESVATSVNRSDGESANTRPESRTA